MDVTQSAKTAEWNEIKGTEMSNEIMFCKNTYARLKETS